MAQKLLTPINRHNFLPLVGSNWSSQTSYGSADSRTSEKHDVWGQDSNTFVIDLCTVTIVNCLSCLFAFWRGWFPGTFVQSRFLRSLFQLSSIPSTAQLVFAIEKKNGKLIRCHSPIPNKNPSTILFFEPFKGRIFALEISSNASNVDPTAQVLSQCEFLFMTSPWPITAYTLKNTTIKSYAHFAVRLCHNVTFSGSTYGSSKRMTFKSWRDSVSFISSYITRCDESWKTKPRGYDSYGTLGKNLESVFPTNTKWTDIKGLCVKPTQDSGQVPIASPFLISHAETNILRFSKSYEHVRRDSQESPNGVNNACSRQKFFLPNNCSTVQASFLPNLKWEAPILHFSHKNKSFSDFMPNDARNL